MTLHIDAILIDDDPLVHATWEFSALRNNRKFIAFNDPLDFFEFVSEDVSVLSPGIPIYIDSNLGNGVKGEIVSKEIYEMGYKMIYIISGYEKHFFSKDLPWISDILGKSPPW